MGYMHIENLYKNQDILMFKECYALEKIHGTSAHIGFKADCLLDDVEECIYKLSFYSGGANHELFESLFDRGKLGKKFCELGHMNVVVYGEAYGGNMQGMSHTYGDNLRFVVFDVMIGGSWLDVPNAANVAQKLGLEFVSYERIPTTLNAIDAERDKHSIQAIRNGVGIGHKREGIVLRPIEEFVKNSGKRIICKHKRQEFMETKTPRQVSPEKLRIITQAREVAEEWVTDMRLNHILQNFEEELSEGSIGKIIPLMIEDIKREAEGEIEWNKNTQKEIGKNTAVLIKRRLGGL